MTRRHRRLGQLSALADVPDSSLDRIEALSTPITLRAGVTLCREGDVGREAFLVVDGPADVTRGGSHVADIIAGDVVGELALLGDGRRTATVVTTAPMTALVMSPREFASVLSLPGFRDAVLRIAEAHAA
jgi:CRP-like cAMP-binding protein